VYNRFNIPAVVPSSNAYQKLLDRKYQHLETLVSLFNNHKKGTENIFQPI